MTIRFVGKSKICWKGPSFSPLLLAEAFWFPSGAETFGLPLDRIFLLAIISTTRKRLNYILRNPILSNVLNPRLFVFLANRKIKIAASVLLDRFAKPSHLSLWICLLYEINPVQP